MLRLTLSLLRIFSRGDLEGSSNDGRPCVASEDDAAETESRAVAASRLSEEPGRPEGPPHACVAAFAASGRLLLIVVLELEDEGRAPSLPPVLRVFSIPVLLWGLGVLDFFAADSVLDAKGCGRSGVGAICG